jgi:hypothetical protein
MDSDPNVMEMTNQEIFENYNLFGIKPVTTAEHKSLRNDKPLFIYKKCFIHRDDGVQYSNRT